MLLVMHRKCYMLCAQHAPMQFNHHCGNNHVLHWCRGREPIFSQIANKLNPCRIFVFELYQA